MSDLAVKLAFMSKTNKKSNTVFECVGGCGRVWASVTCVYLCVHVHLCVYVSFCVCTLHQSSRN